MAASFANGTLTLTKAITLTQARRYVASILAAEGIAVPAGATDQQKLDLFDDWLWKYLKADAISYEARQAAATQAAASNTELP